MGTNTTVASGGITLGTDTYLYRSAASTLKTDSALIVAPTNNPSSSLIVNPTISPATANARLIAAAGTFTGSGDGPGGIASQVTFNPSANITVAYGFINIAKGSPGAGIGITTLNAGYNRIDTGSSGGTVTSANALVLAAPSLGSTIPGTITGVNVQNQGVAGVGTAIGLDVAAQTGATTDIGLRIAPASTYTLQLTGTGGTASTGIEFSTDTDLYRSGANALQTDGTLAATAGLRAGSVCATSAKLCSSTGAQAAAVFKQTGSSDILDLQNNGTNVVQVTSTGSTLFQNSANSTTAFQILDSGSVNVAAADTTTDTLTVDNLTVTGNCVGCGSVGTVSLQSAYTAGATIGTTDNKSIAITLVDTTTDSSFTVNSACTPGSTCSAGGGKFQVQSAGTGVFTVAAGGAVTSQNSANSSSAFLIQNAAGSNNTDNLLSLSTVYNASNKITNGSFEVDNTGWGATANVAISQVTNQKPAVWFRRYADY